MKNNSAPLLYNLNIERAILSAIIFAPFELDTFDSLPAFSIFYLPGHQDIYNAILHLYDMQKPIEEEFIKSYLNKKEKFNEIQFLEVLSASPISVLPSYIKELEQLAAKRKLILLTSEIRSNIDKSIESELIIELAEKRLFEMTEEKNVEGFVGIDTALDLANDHIELMQSKENGLIGIDTGFTKLNALTSGFNAGDLIILAARPSMGKTSLAINMMLETSKFGNGVALLSLEMPKDQVALRMLSMQSGVPLQDIRTGKLDSSKKQKIYNAKQDISQKDILIDDTPTLTMRQIRSKVRRIMTKNKNIKLIILDYLQLISSNDSKDRHLQVAEISRGLKLLARELDVAIIALSQLNRSLESRVDKRPMLSDLRESGSIEQDADVILFIYREDVYKKQEEKQKEQEFRKKGIDYTSVFKDKAISPTELIIGKQRNGPLGTVFLEFIKQSASFQEKNRYESSVMEITYED